MCLKIHIFTFVYKNIKIKKCILSLKYLNNKILSNFFRSGISEGLTADS